METTIEHTACLSCGADKWDVEGICPDEKCQNRLCVGYKYSMDAIHEVAKNENKLRRLYGDESSDERWYRWSELDIESSKNYTASRESIREWGDFRIRNLVENLWDCLSGDVERDETWGMFVEELGMPDLRSKEYRVTITIEVDVEAKDEDEAMEKAQEEVENDTYRYLRDADFDYYEM